MKDNMIYQDVFKCSNCGYEMDENYIGCPKCKEFGTIKFLRNVAVGPCNCAVCIEEMKYAEEAKKHEEEQRAKHFNHPFYINARKIWTNHQWAQIEKGAVKYPEPFTPSSWTNEQLVEHALQENVDQLHYIVGIKERMEEQAKEIERLNKENENQLHYINSARKDYSESIETINELQKENAALERLKDDWYNDFKEMETKYNSKLEEYEFLFEQTGKQQEKIIVLNRKELALKAMVDRIQAALNSGKITADVAKFLMDNREKGEF
jgi:hypothetical protein